MHSSFGTGRIYICFTLGWAKPTSRTEALRFQLAAEAGEDAPTAMQMMQTT